MTNYAEGHEAEKVAAQYLIGLGYKIEGLNWKTKYCEIDIVATKNKIAYLAEVKSRRSFAFGTGFDYITPVKLQRMSFAAEIWVAQTNWPGSYQLAAIEMNNGQVMNFLPEL